MENVYTPFEVLTKNKEKNFIEVEKFEEFYLLRLSKFESQLRDSNSWVRITIDMENPENDLVYRHFSKNIPHGLKEKIEKNTPLSICS